jgi:hypothetical protein
VLLKKYREPSWNFPVVRFIDGRGRDLLPRKDRVYTVQGIRDRMKRALAKAQTARD